jgi:hypothetical protein
MHLHTTIYSQICKTFPVFCVDISLRRNDKYLLIKRSMPPLKDEYWVPGGRLYHMETIIQAAKRILWRELRFSPVTLPDFKIIGFSNYLFNESCFGEHNYHTPALLVETEISYDPLFILDDTSTDFLWSKSLPPLLTSSLNLFS